MDHKKTICIVMGGHFSATIGGAQYQARCIVDRLVELGRYNIYYLTRVFDPVYRPIGYKIIKIANAGGIRGHGFAFDARRLFILLKQIKPDVIYQRGLKAHTGIIAYYCKHATCKSIFHIAHDYDLMPLHMWGRSRLNLLLWLDKRMGEYGLRRVDRVIAQTRYQSNLLMKNYGREANAVIPNFHSFPEETIEKQAHPVRIVWVANFKPVKRPELFVRLASDLSDRDNMHFIMIGRPGGSGEYDKLHQDMRQLDNLTYMGEQPIDEVNRQLAAAHIFVNTSQAEGFPNTFIQAWMRKVPTLSLDVDPDNVLEKLSIGYCTGSFQTLREKVLELSDNASIREEMGVRAQNHAFDKHSPKAVDKLLEFIDG